MPGFWLGYCPGFWKAGFLEIHLVTMVSEEARKRVPDQAFAPDRYRREGALKGWRRS